MKTTIITVLLLLLSFSSCVGPSTTEVTSMKEPNFDFRKNQNYVVKAYYENMSMVKNIENIISHILFENNIYVIPNHRILPPINEHSKEHIKEVFQRNNINGMIIISQKDKYIKNVFEPGYTETRISTEGDSNSVWTKRSTKHVPAREYKVLNAVKTVVEIVGVPNNQKLWYAEAITDLEIKNPYLGDKYIKSFCWNLAVEFENYGFIKNIPSSILYNLNYDRL